jgi:lipopolysaccharide assembly protein A
MQFIKILLWVLLLVGSFIFWWTNEARTTLDLGAAVVEARTSTFVLLAFLIGFLPTWLLLRGSKWRLMRRIKTLETAARPAPAPVTAPPPSAPLDVEKTDIKEASEVKPAVTTETNSPQKEESSKP